MGRGELPYLRHMLDAAGRIQSYVAGVRRQEFDDDHEKQDAVVRQLEILGEAASQVPEKVRLDSPEIPWSKMVGMRNRLIHAYMYVDLDVVWLTATTRMADLSDQLRTILDDLGE